MNIVFKENDLSFYNCFGDSAYSVQVQEFAGNPHTYLTINIGKAAVTVAFDSRDEVKDALKYLSAYLSDLYKSYLVQI